MEKLHPGAKWKFRVGGYVGVLVLFLFFVVPFLFASSAMEIGNVFWIAIGGIILLIILIEIVIQLEYINWKYEFTSDSLKIEKGIIVKRYKSIPYERIQNVDITRGILARIIGFSTIDIQTAGYSMAYGGRGRTGFSEGHIPAVSREGAEKIRDFLVKKISHKKSAHSGL
jgi:uncharacterized membrane protein YdbT with pleckstrin-like domain